MMVMAMTTIATHGFGQILDARELAGLRRRSEVRRELAELFRRRRITVGGGSLGGCLQVHGDLLGDLLVLARVRLLKLLQRAQHLGERRKLVAIRLGRTTDARCAVRRRTGSQAVVL